MLVIIILGLISLCHNVIFGWNSYFVVKLVGFNESGAIRVGN